MCAGSGNAESPHRISQTSLIVSDAIGTDEARVHLQAQRQADEQYRQDLLNFERERAKSERENLTAIATSILGHISGFYLRLQMLKTMRVNPAADLLHASATFLLKGVPTDRTFR